VDKSEINVQNKYNLNSSKIVIENSIELKGRKINQNMENDMKNKLFKCVWPQCRYSSKQKVNLNQHILIHSEGERFKCDFNGCNKFFKYRSNLFRDKKIHFGKNQFFKTNK
jgi:hypothetical protein